ncbi:GTP cyclohydrolase 1 type 2 [Nocardioides baekrokdamisoli]|uniref:GTP cyclohydrolase 1 type 2 homolog n=1 Tax=Nocardioides baekrokdamisoli TaxID=1804624 RepID=A0A3G9IQP9_9ACTN|nr:Nif3-like dinuclear metal center hexameric protein [Nocardioides baekrokdamisoli]BBH18385.1 GTP cyclohydrolase 1 type 2 [Nocardioides baekrokdamisoli]
MPALGDVVDLVHSWFPPSTAESWDAVGLVSGDPAAPVRTILLAVDAAPEVAAEAASIGADLLLVHHPLFFKPVHSVAATTPKGRTLWTLSSAGCALLAAHTNADQAVGGVSESMAYALGLTDLEPLVGSTALDSLVTYVPVDAAAAVRAALAAAGAGGVGNYDTASFSNGGTGRFRPLEGARPAVGVVGEVEEVAEERIEVILPRSARAAVVSALLGAHPYETPAYQVIELVSTADATSGHGRIGSIEPTTLRLFAETVSAALPATAAGIRIGGDLDKPIRRVALCGGAGASFLPDVARTDADVYVTSDLGHHTAGEFLEAGGAALIDVPHWAAESTWLPVVAARLREALGDKVEVVVSEVVTDPWTLRL